ncbi:uncharacterized protein KY384_004515 [Bacidia gigantensis]|uniref:uncharacterized protein n=1 Tax=Bacidia gigantensis TaxID=2732470 RepID=UPI001D0372A3|nr:uncharacterized protein KY384_004515 [Bacidia gigantensis]KAG8531157.1 hypothetical protein KY384_004515 [Bacidia gigantensis]
MIDRINLARTALSGVLLSRSRLPVKDSTVRPVRSQTPGQPVERKVSPPFSSIDNFLVAFSKLRIADRARHAAPTQQSASAESKRQLIVQQRIAERRQRVISNLRPQEKEKPVRPQYINPKAGAGWKKPWARVFKGRQKSKRVTFAPKLVTATFYYPHVPPVGGWADAVDEDDVSDDEEETDTPGQDGQE